MSKRKVVLVPVILITVLALTGAAFAAFSGKLRGKGSGQSLRISWVSAGTSSDSGTELDPLTFGMNPTRDLYNIGVTDDPTLTGGVLTVTHTGVFDQYKATVWGSAKVTGNGANTFKVQKVRIVQDGSNPIPSGLSAYLAPAACGLTLPSDSTGIGVQIGLGFTGETVPDTFSYGLEVDIVPAGAYSAGSCVSWPVS